MEEAAHEQIEALRLRAEKENEIAEIQAEAKREEEQSQVEAQAAEAKAVYEHASKSTFAPTVKSGNSQ